MRIKRIPRALLASTHLSLSKLQAAADAVATGAVVVYVRETDEIEVHAPDEIDPDSVIDAVKVVPVTQAEADATKEAAARDILEQYSGEQLVARFRNALQRIRALEDRVQALENK